MLDGHRLRQKFRDIRDAAAYRFCRFGYIFLGICLKRGYDIVDLRVEQKRTMAVHFSFGGKLGVA
ncbi:hypothetical protein D3C80_1810550 [compost metagenome]